jgi:hypothetical protein
MPLFTSLVPIRGLGAPPADASEWLGPALAQVWTEAGIAAHAAVAAQAEFAVHLLRLGAPASLLHGSARALLDETLLSAACLDLAQKHGADRPMLTVIPRRSDSANIDRAEFVLSTLRRGCIAATVESSCAREALEHCQDPEARELLQQLQHTRARSAQLSWRFLGWALRDTGAALADQVRVLVLTALGSQPPMHVLTQHQRQLLRHGVLADEQRRAIEQRVLRDIVLPCMENALARAASSNTAA